MADQLLPPDPSKDGWYWVRQKDVGPDPWQWLASPRQWAVGAWAIKPDEAALLGILASPHPIPGPEQLDVLHALPAAMRKEAVTNWSARSQHDHVTAAVGQAAVCAAMLRASLGAKPSPNELPGNGLDDIRAAAMDQRGAPRAGKGTGHD